jgi:hypothetical protein
MWAMPGSMWRKSIAYQRQAYNSKRIDACLEIILSCEN